MQTATQARGPVTMKQEWREGRLYQQIWRSPAAKHGILRNGFYVLCGTKGGKTARIAESMARARLVEREPNNSLCTALMVCNNGLLRARRKATRRRAATN